MVNYPAQIDTTQSLPTVVDNLTPVQGKVFNTLRDAVLAIEATLGVQPNGLYTTVGNRLTTLEGLIAGTPIIQITQDLGGTPDSPLVIGIQGRPVADSGPAVGQVLAWDGIAWLPTTISTAGAVIFAGDLTGISSHQTVIGIRGTPVSATAPTTGQSLVFNGTQWAPGSGFTPGGDLSGTTTSQTVIGIQNHPVTATTPILGNFLTYNGTQWTPANLTPLTRTKWIDAGAALPGSADGSIELPYAAINDWLAALGVPLSSADASNIIVGLVALDLPSTEPATLSIPAYRNIELHGVNHTPSNGTLLTNIIWNNVAGGGAVAPSSGASLTLYNISLNEGNITVTDDGSVSSTLSIGRDTVSTTYDFSNLNTNGTTSLTQAIISNSRFDGGISVNSGTTLTLDNCFANGNVGGAFQFTATNCTFQGVFVSNLSFPQFYDCRFNGTIFFVPSGAQWKFDGPSWRSFREGAGSLSFADTTNGSVLVVGGYLGGEVLGTDYIDSASTTVVSLDGGSATVGYQNGGNHYTIPAATLAGDFRVLQLSTSAVRNGDTIMVTRQDVSGNRFLVKNNAGTIILTMPGWRTNFGLFTYSSAVADWVLTSSGGDNNPSYTSNSTLSINNASSPTILLAWNVVKVDTTGGAPPSITTPPTTAVLDLDRFMVIDANAHFATIPCVITAAAGETIEDPNSPGTFSPTVTLSANSASVEWLYDLANTRWKVI